MEEVAPGFAQIEDSESNQPAKQVKRPVQIKGHFFTANIYYVALPRCYISNGDSAKLPKG